MKIEYKKHENGNHFHILLAIFPLSMKYRKFSYFRNKISFYRKLNLFYLNFLYFPKLCKKGYKNQK
jgi:hypothetical protein